MNKLFGKTFLIALCVIGFTVTGNAQPGPPPPPDENPVPITGIEFLIAAGAAFGAKKVYDKRKAK
ncbi:hypothetical protein JKA74_07235 [Marivirga sp. S37H4]|uniref:PEP-CTERM protein-sorting domain-containing protein n=1 Tax=Marivirga aurantiaca TaxID=2802615 RepID=A0A934WXU6_9BACT|nr:hypothetical protein [Marivirga aurantiaca]MBK6264825.1 hypothetical protein [Marivirga aurantiaca]